MTDSKHLMGELVFVSNDGWKIYSQDAGMGEHNYAVFRNEVFFCRTDNRADADEIIGAVRFAANMRNAERHDGLVRNEERLSFLTLLKEIGDGISAYEKEHEHMQVWDDCLGIFIPTNVVRRLIQKRREIIEGGLK